MPKRARNDPSHGNGAAGRLGHDPVHHGWRSDWASLPSELIDDIANRLLRHDVAMYLRLRAACRAWRECTADPGGGGDLDSRFRPRLWIMLSNCDGVRRRFLNLATGACAHVDLPELSGHHLESSTESLLVLRDKASDAIRLLNPFTRALTDLPAITAALSCMEPNLERRLGRTISIAYRLRRPLRRDLPPATVVLFTRGQVWNIAYAKPGDELWALMDKGWKSYQGC